MKVALYARVSKDEAFDDARYQNPDNQLLPLREWVKNQGWVIVQEYIDYKSGADPNREGFNKMISDGMQQKYKAVLVWKLDRFSRESTGRVLSWIQKLKDRGVAVKSLTEHWLDTSADNPIGDIILAVMAWAAAEERRKISERTKAAIRRQKALGVWKGGRPRKEKGVPPNVRGKKED